MNKQLWDVRFYGVKAGKQERLDMLAEAASQQEAEALVIIHYQHQGYAVMAVSSVLVAEEN